MILFPFYPCRFFCQIEICNWKLYVHVRTLLDMKWSTVSTICFLLFSFEPLLCYTTKATHFFSRCFSIANRQNEGKSKKKKICFELHPRATLFNCLSATLQWGHSRNYCPAKRMFICSKTAQARRDRERQFWEKKYSNKLSMKALAGWKHFLIDSTFRIGTVLEWVFQLVILLNSCFQSDNM